jgi:hypothetical protein
MNILHFSLAIFDAAISLTRRTASAVMTFPDSRNEILLRRNDGLEDQFPVDGDAGQGLAPDFLEPMDAFTGADVPFAKLHDLLNVIG